MRPAFSRGRALCTAATPTAAPVMQGRFPVSQGVIAELRWRGLIAQHTLGTADDRLQRFLDRSPPPSSSAIRYEEQDAARNERESWFLKGVPGGPAREIWGAYAGFDPTAGSLHLGNMVPLVVLRHLMRHGIRGVALVGGATGAIGDPSGRNVERPLMDEEALRVNEAALVAQLMSLLPARVGASAEVAPMRVRSAVTEQDCSILSSSQGDGERRESKLRNSWDGVVRMESEAAMASHGAWHIVNNADWHGGTTVIDFLRDTGRFFRVGSLLDKEALRARLDSEQGLSFTELAYPLFQAADFVHLHRHPDYRCILQVGGSDQWGNITAGCSLVGRKCGHSSSASVGSNDAMPSAGNLVHGLTTPLLTTSDGQKLGKSTGGGNVWLSAERTPPFELYQYLMRRSDDDACRLLRLITFLTPEDIVRVEDVHRSAPEERVAQTALAQAVVEFVHGTLERERAMRASAALFSTGSTSSGDGISDDRLRAMLDLAVAPDTSESVRIPLPRVKVLTVPVVRLFVDAGLCKSMREAKQLFAEGGLYVNDVQVGGPEAAGLAAGASASGVLSQNDLLGQGRFVVLRKGKKHYRIIEAV